MAIHKLMKATAVLALRLFVWLSMVASTYAQTGQWGNLAKEGDALRERGQYAKALVAMQKALDAATEALGPTNLSVATIAYNLAQLYCVQRQCVQAEQLHLRALAIRESILGPDHTDVAQSLNGLASVYADRGLNQKAEPLHSRALAIREKVLGSNHLDVAQSLISLGFLYKEQGEYAKAEPFLERALGIWEDNPCPHQTAFVAVTLKNLAEVCDAQNKYAKAERVYRRTLATWEKNLGPNNPELVPLFEKLALLCKKTNREREAEELERRAANIKSETRPLTNRMDGTGQPTNAPYSSPAPQVQKR